MNLPALWAVGLGALSALISATEGALSSLSRDDRAALERDDTPRAQALRQILADPRRFQITLQIAGEMSLAGCALAIALALAQAGRLADGWWALLLATPLLLVFGLTLPRAIAVRFPRLLARALARTLFLLHYLLFPVVWPLKGLSELLAGWLGFTTNGGNRLEEAELRTLVDIGERAGALREQERTLIHNVFEFGDLLVSEVMTPRAEVVGFDIRTPFSEMLEEIRDQRFARVPVFRDNLDNMLGVLYIKDLLALRIDERGLRSVQELLRPAWFVPFTKKADELFREFQQRKSHLAVVVDEYGGVAGIVTMDDLLSELFGTLLEEHDTEEESDFVELPDGSYRVQAQMELERFCELLGLEPPDEDDEFSTVGGLVLTRFGLLPPEGESIRFDGLEITVEKVDGTRLDQLRVRRVAPLEEREGDAP